MSKLFRCLAVVVVVLAPLSLLASALWLIGPMRVYVLSIGLFGLWTLLCVAFGAWIEHGRQYGKSPLPGLPNNWDAATMFKWLRDGDQDQKPPLDEEDEESKPAGFNL